ncbi:hypothetical protein PRK78_004240 [Emydomyces testavorans]|uniref:Uncharacterized protein n=1 Tax=Emydomyces testavorans TaxID=2070801 RepID=A0AAF0DHQ2_9EURO|nr:hypothetical protein PRK78_004240 [Emydomyces testavorans]
MPPASSPPRHYRPASTTTGTSLPSSIIGEVVQSKKKKNAARRDNKTAKAETKTLLGDLEASQSLNELYGPIPARLATTHMANNTESPVLDALSTLPPPEEHDITIRTDTWAKSIPFGKSPPQHATHGGNAEESPPTFSLPADSGGFQDTAVSTPPPVSKPRPISLGTEHLSPSRHRSQDRQKRNSINAQHHYPPPPHLPQAHFYSAPDIEIPGVPSPIMGAAQEKGCSFFAIDILPSHKYRVSGKKVLMIGRDSMLEVLALESEQTRVVGLLKGLNGRVLDAKILTWTSGTDPFSSSRPLVAVTIFGPVHQEDSGQCSSAASNNADLVPGVAIRQDVYSNRTDLPRMQTQVQVYSLKTQSLIASLFATKPEPCFITIPGTSPSVPPAAGDLKIYSGGNYIVLASGTSGEVFVFGASGDQSSGPYCCLGKTWTSVRTRDSRRYSNSSNSTNADEIPSEQGGREIETPILSLSGRWLAIAPPPPNRTSLHGTIHCSMNQKRIYEIDAHNPPSRPSVTCSVDCNQESLFTKLTKGVTQEFFRGATWTGGQVAQTWNSYFNRDTQPNQTSIARRAHLFESPNTNFLPPTHAQETQQPLAKEPDLISLIDLKRLEDGEGAKSSTMIPVATFQPPSGCSFVSLSPNGLMLLTASRKGDVQHVWDLMQMRHCRARTLMAEDTPATATSSAHVREIAKFDRLTVTSILDVRWTGPTGERLAVVTKNNTIHLYDIPRGAFQWPPLRRVQRQLPTQQPNTESTPREDLNDTGPGSRFSTAVKAIGGTTQPIIAAFRGRAPSVGAGLATGAGFGFASARGSKVITFGLSKSVGAATETVNALRHFGDNRLYLGSFAKNCAISRMIWFGDEKEPLLGIVDGEFFKVYQIRRGSLGKKKQDQSVFGAKLREIRLPSNLRVPVGPSQALLTMSNLDVTGFWSLPLSAYLPSPGGLRSSPLSQAEIETNAPYQPFHTDRRVNLMAYSADHKEDSTDTDPWVFGNSIPSIKLQVHGYAHQDDGVANEQSLDDGDMENLISLGSGSANVEFAVITTRRKKKTISEGAGGTVGGDDDGFFEDDCDILDFASDRV